MSMGDIDCGDNSCVFAWERRGMRTNGGCRCFRADLPCVPCRDLHSWARKAKAKIRDLENDLAEANKRIKLLEG